MKWSWWVLFGASACWGGPSHPADDTHRHGTAPATAPVSDAERYEHGDGVARDYRRAVELYDASCDLGNGDLLSCRRELLLLLHGRGVKPARLTDPAVVIQRVCDRGDWVVCAFPGATYDEARARDACNAGAADACFAVAEAGAWSQSDTVQDRIQRSLVKACNGGILEACIELVGREPASGATAEAVERITRACKSGDADACASQKTPIDPQEMCRAFDSAACNSIRDL